MQQSCPDGKPCAHDPTICWCQNGDEYQCVYNANQDEKVCVKYEAMLPAFIRSTTSKPFNDRTKKPKKS